jgi:hypothetical protein
MSCPAYGVTKSAQSQVQAQVLFASTEHRSRKCSLPYLLLSGWVSTFSDVSGHGISIC